MRKNHVIPNLAPRDNICTSSSNLWSGASLIKIHKSDSKFTYKCQWKNTSFKYTFYSEVRFIKLHNCCLGLILVFVFLGGAWVGGDSAVCGRVQCWRNKLETWYCRAKFMRFVYDNHSLFDFFVNNLVFECEMKRSLLRSAALIKRLQRS